jgi:4'-phosphopantetheinyl transferase
MFGDDGCVNTSQARWAAAELRNLSDGEVHIWRSWLDLSPAAIEKATGLLADDEVARARRYRFTRDRGRFVAARAFLRRTLAGYLSTAPARLAFSYGRFGRPELVPSPGDETVSFNLSHSGDMALLAITCERRVGIDIERLEHRADLPAVAAHFFSARENAALNDIPAEGRDLAFYRCWTRKEAFLKALGDGLAYPLDAFDVSLDLAPRLLRIGNSSEAPSQWTLHHLEPALGYVAALAIDGRGVDVVWRGCASLPGQTSHPAYPEGASLATCAVASPMGHSDRPVAGGPLAP